MRGVQLSPCPYFCAHHCTHWWFRVTDKPDDQVFWTVGDKYAMSKHEKKNCSTWHLTQAIKGFMDKYPGCSRLNDPSIKWSCVFALALLYKNLICESFSGFVNHFVIFFLCCYTWGCLRFLLSCFDPECRKRNNLFCLLKESNEVETQHRPLRLQQQLLIARIIPMRSLRWHQVGFIHLLKMISELYLCKEKSKSLTYTKILRHKILVIDLN